MNIRGPPFKHLSLKELWELSPSFIYKLYLCFLSQVTTVTTVTGKGGPGFLSLECSPFLVPHVGLQVGTLSQPSLLPLPDASTSNSKGPAASQHARLIQASFLFLFQALTTHLPNKCPGPGAVLRPGMPWDGLNRS